MIVRAENLVPGIVVRGDQCMVDGCEGSQTDREIGVLLDFINILVDSKPILCTVAWDCGHVAYDVAVANLEGVVKAENLVPGITVRGERCVKEECAASQADQEIGVLLDIYPTRKFGDVAWKCGHIAYEVKIANLEGVLR